MLHDAQALHAVGPALGQELFQRRAVLRAEGDDEGAVAAEGDAELLAQRRYMRAPRTFSRAFSVPGCASKPACTIALFAFDAPSATSLPASRTASERLYLDSSLATAQPTTPAPAIIASYFSQFSMFCS